MSVQYAGSTSIHNVNFTCTQKIPTTPDGIPVALQRHGCAQGAHVGHRQVSDQAHGHCCSELLTSIVTPARTESLLAGYFPVEDLEKKEHSNMARPGLTTGVTHHENSQVILNSTGDSSAGNLHAPLREFVSATTCKIAMLKHGLQPASKSPSL